MTEKSKNNGVYKPIGWGTFLFVMMLITCTFLNRNFSSSYISPNYSSSNYISSDYVSPDEVSKITYSISCFYPNSGENKCTFDFETNQIYICFADNEDIPNKEESYNINKDNIDNFFNTANQYGFFNMDTQYSNNSVCDGCGESINITYKDGSVDKTGFYYNFPKGFSKVIKAMELMLPPEKVSDNHIFGLDEITDYEQS